MKQHVLEFLRRGLSAAAGGPVVLALIYGYLGATGEVTALSHAEVCTGVLTVTLMAFIAAGITMVYQVEQLPLPSAILIHGGVAYLDYLLIYLVNRWLPRNWEAIGTFTAIFAAIYAVVWLLIYCSTRAKAERLNKKMH